MADDPKMIVQFTFRMTPEDENIVKEAAQKFEITPGEVLRRLVRGRQLHALDERPNVQSNIRSDSTPTKPRA